MTIRIVSILIFLLSSLGIPNNQINPSGLHPVNNVLAQAASPFVTAPADLPLPTVTTPANDTADGYLFMAAYPWAPQNHLDMAPYLLILDNQGQPVYWKNLDRGFTITDFKKQPNGWLTYYDQSLDYFIALDNTYHEVTTIHAVDYPNADLHDLQILPNGHFLFMVYANRTMDLTSYGGLPNATVLELVIQELDENQNLVFEWKSLDPGHFAIADTYIPMDTAIVDYVHGNAVELDTDGNLLLSSRHLQEITKINRTTGNIIWRMGGKNNQFIFVNDPNDGFHWQHDIRRLPNGDVTLFDNRTDETPVYSRAVEYQLDENNHTATLVWQYRNPLDTLGAYMGDVQRLPNGNTLIGWGSGNGDYLNLPSFANLTEVKPDGSKALELSLPQQYVSYRAFRFVWHGYPTWTPSLVVHGDAISSTLYYSWNGATDISKYHIYGGKWNDRFATQLLDTQTKTGFEDTTTISELLEQYCYFRVVPVDTSDQETTSSGVAANPNCQASVIYLPQLMQP